jgi:hypothetical protein
MPISPVNLRWLTEPHDGHAALQPDARSPAITVEFAMTTPIKGQFTHSQLTYHIHCSGLDVRDGESTARLDRNYGSDVPSSQNCPPESG